MSRIAALYVVVACLFPVGSLADTLPDVTHGYVPESERQLLPSAITSYTSTMALTESAVRSIASLDGGEREVLTRPNSLSYGAQPAATSDKKPNYLPVLYSAIIPGAGEMSMGYYVRGAFLMALEASAWLGYASFHSGGLDKRDEYEAFADMHWSQADWISQHQHVYPENSGVITTPAQMDSIGVIVSGSGEWPGYIPWVSKEEDKQHYYENIGKYDWYISGWADYNPEGTDEEKMFSELRDEYAELRDKSNSDLKTANRFIYLSLATRAFSLIQTTLLVRKSIQNHESASLDNRIGVSARAVGFTGGQIAVEYHFK